MTRRERWVYRDDPEIKKKNINGFIGHYIPKTTVKKEPRNLVMKSKNEMSDSIFTMPFRKSVRSFDE